MGIFYDMFFSPGLTEYTVKDNNSHAPEATLPHNMYMTQGTCYALSQVTAAAMFKLLII